MFVMVITIMTMMTMMMMMMMITIMTMMMLMMMFVCDGDLCSVKTSRNFLYVPELSRTKFVPELRSGESRRLSLFGENLRFSL